MDRNTRTLAIMLDALSQVSAPHAVFGGLLAEYYGKRQGTGDVDLMVPRRSFEPLKAVLEERGYEVRQYPYVMRMCLRGEPVPVGDFLAAEANEVVEIAFGTRTPAVIKGLAASVVPRGAFVALKFEAAVRSRRLSKDRVVDVHDIRGVLERRFGPEDERLAAQLAGKMFRGAVADLASLLDDLRHARWPRVVIRAETRAALLRRQGLAALRRR